MSDKSMGDTKKTVTILGSTGSVGINTLKVIADFPERFRVAGLAAGSNIDVLKQQIEAFSPHAVYVKDEAAASEIRRVFSRLKVYSDGDGLHAFSDALDSDILVAATSGTSGLLAVIAALRKGRRVALANKEILVMAGHLVMSTLRAHPEASLIPVDSEHSAIFQCLQGNSVKEAQRLILTGSGGPLRDVDARTFGQVSKETVINHPKWKMGKKISVDSATLMNKGLEIIEAYWLFGLPIDRIEVMIHPEAIVHSMVEYKDGSVLAQLGATDMRMPIQYALCYPERLTPKTPMRIDLLDAGHLTFLKPDRKKFPCLDLAYEAARRAGSTPCVLSAADEVAVGAYLEDRIGFVQIPKIIEKVLSKHDSVADPDLEHIRSIHEWATEETKKLCRI